MKTKTRQKYEHRTTGFVLIYRGRPVGWVSDLSRPQDFLAGVIAAPIGELRGQYVASGNSTWLSLGGMFCESVKGEGNRKEK
jgi:hypothetical protein